MVEPLQDIPLTSVEMVSQPKTVESRGEKAVFFEVNQGLSCLYYVPPNVTLINNPQLMLERGNHLVSVRDRGSLMRFSLHELQAKLTALLVHVSNFASRLLVSFCCSNGLSIVLLHVQVARAVLGAKCKDIDNRGRRLE